MNSSRSKVVWTLLLVIRLGLGAVFAYAAWTKLRDPWLLFAMSIDAYHVLPEWGVTLVARTLPWAELVLGLLLIVGIGRRVSSVAASALLTVFFGLMVRAYAQGQTIACGCFGPGEAISPVTLLRDGSMLAGAVFLAVMSFRARRGPRATPRAAEDLVAANLGERANRSA